jgi:hypothetical protein
MFRNAKNSEHKFEVIIEKKVKSPTVFEKHLCAMYPKSAIIVSPFVLEGKRLLILMCF